MNAPLDDPETLQLLVRRLPEAVYVTNEEGEIVDSNAAFLEIVGIGDRKELASLRVFDLLVHPATREAELEKLQSTGVLRNWEFRSSGSAVATAPRGGSSTSRSPAERERASPRRVAAATPGAA